MEQNSLNKCAVNSVKKMTEALVEVMKYHDPAIDYPSLEAVKPNDGVMAEWFYPSYNKDNLSSELAAILQYMAMDTKYEDEVGEILHGIAMTEMQHYSKLGEMIQRLGGIFDKPSAPNIIIGKNGVEAIKLAIKSEKTAIANYKDLQEKIQSLPITATAQTAIQLVGKLLVDEKVHLFLFKNKLFEMVDSKTYTEFINESD